MEAVGSALAKVVGQSPPKSLSPPRKLLSSNTYALLPPTPTPPRQQIRKLQGERKDDDVKHTFEDLVMEQQRKIEDHGIKSHLLGSPN